MTIGDHTTGADLRAVILFGFARIALFVLIGVFALTAIFFVWFALIPTISDATTGETTYRMLFDSFTLDGRVASLLTVSMEMARKISHLLVAAMLLLTSIVFLQALLIVNSARSGDPFTPANAARLSRMGWIVLAPVLLTILSRLLRFEAPDLSVIMQMTFVSSIGFLLLILAEVFRKGLAMREDLERTV